ncbi:hypothetical protein EMGBS6_14870, partial [Opitutia bacterium]
MSQGLPWPTESSPVAHDPSKHWAFKTVKAPASPAITPSDEAKVRQPLDRFVLAKLKSAGLDFNPEAPREVVIRRLTLALWGFNPSAEEIAAYVNDKDPQAIENWSIGSSLPQPSANAGPATGSTSPATPIRRVTSSWKNVAT